MNQIRRRICSRLEDKATGALEASVSPFLLSYLCHFLSSLKCWTMPEHTVERSSVLLILYNLHNIFIVVSKYTVTGEQ